MHQKKLSQVLDLIINEETGPASELLHEILVEKARVIYEEVVDDECEEACEESEEQDDEPQLNEFAEPEGDEKDGFAADIAQDEDEINADELEDFSDVDGEGDLEGLDDEGELDGEGEVEDRVEDLEMALSDLRAEFDQLMAQELEEPNHDAEDFDGLGDLGIEDEMGDDELGEPVGDFEEEEFEENYVGEATQFQHEVGGEPLGKEKSADKKSPYTKAPSKKDHGGAPVKFAKDSGDGKEADKTAKKEKCEDNIDVPNKDQKADMSGEGKYSGTGKGSKKGAVHSKSPLSKKPK